jgi:hypothetical protein
VKNLKLSVIIVCTGIIFLLMNGATDFCDYHDLGPQHIDTNVVACIHASYHKVKIPPVLPGPIFSQILSETPLHGNSLSSEETRPPAFAYINQFPTRASPA